MPKLIAIKVDRNDDHWINPDHVQRVQAHNQNKEKGIIFFSNGTTLVCSQDAKTVAAQLST